MDLPELTGIQREVSLRQLLAQAYQLHSISPADSGAAGLAEGFWLERLRYALEQRGFPTGQVRAVTHGVADQLVPLQARRKLEVLPDFTSSPEFTQLATAFKRVKNIARELPANAAPDMSALQEPAESALLKELEERQQVIERAVAAGDYRRGFAEAAKFGPSVDRFFTDVFVMADDQQLRTARLALMKRLESLILGLADISEIVAQ